MTSFANRLKRCNRAQILTEELLVGRGLGFGFVPAVAQFKLGLSSSAHRCSNLCFKGL